jgi:hypothetical protein
VLLLFVVSNTGVWEGLLGKAAYKIETYPEESTWLSLLKALRLNLTNLPYESAGKLVTIKERKVGMFLTYGSLTTLTSTLGIPESALSL